MIWNREPALFFTLAAAVIGLLVAFGVNITTEQSAAIMAVLVAVAGVIVRQKVTPTA